MGFPKAKKPAATPRRANKQLPGRLTTHDFTRLVRVIGQAAREAFSLFSDVLEKRAIQSGPPWDPTKPEVGGENSALETDPSPEQPERFLSVADVAVRLGVSEKTVRRMIARGDLRAHRVGRLIRVAERSLAAYLGNPNTRARITSKRYVKPG
jgi:excisionase family DNA binding protein